MTSYNVIKTDDGYRIIETTTNKEERLSSAAYEALMVDTLTNARLGQVLNLVGPTHDMANHAGLMIADAARGNLLGVSTHFTGLTTSLHGVVQLRSYRDPDTGSGVREEWLVESATNGAEILRRFRVETASVETPPHDLEQRGLRLQVWYGLRQAYQAGLTMVSRNITPVARETAAAVREIGSAIAPFTFKNLSLASLATPITRYTRDTVEQALTTRKIVARAQRRTADKTRAEVEGHLREEAKKTFGEHLRGLFGSGDTSTAPAKK
jgi:hypothetical protein